MGKRINFSAHSLKKKNFSAHYTYNIKKIKYKWDYFDSVFKNIIRRSNKE